MAGSGKKNSMYGKHHTEEAKQKLSKGIMKSGSHSAYIRNQYFDPTTPEGAQLKAAIDGLIDDCGGPDKISNKGNMLLDSIRSKLIVMFRISEYIQTHKIIREDGSLIPCLGSHYIAYSNGLRRDLQLLDELAKIKPSKTLSLEQIISQHDKETKK